jgi:hypothetical protein
MKPIFPEKPKLHDKTSPRPKEPEPVHIKPKPNKSPISLLASKITEFETNLNNLSHLNSASTKPYLDRLTHFKQSLHALKQNSADFQSLSSQSQKTLQNHKFDHRQELSSHARETNEIASFLITQA